MKTGLTVNFRNRKTLRDTAESGSVPLFFAKHIQDGKVVFPTGKEHEYLVTNHSGLLQQNTNYWIRIHDVIAFPSENYGITYAENRLLLLRIMAKRQIALTIGTA